METQATETQMERQVPNWTFEGKEYPCFVANEQDSIAIQIKHPVTEKIVGILNANFQWEKSEAFLEHLTMDFKDVKDTKDGIIERQQKNFTRQNAKLFKRVCVGGSLVKINEFDEHSEPVEKSIAQMNAYPPEIQSELIDKWLGNFHISRHFPDGVDELDALLGSADAIYFVCRIGNQKTPSNVIMIQFNLPSEDARRSFEDNNVKRQREVVGTSDITYIDVNWTNKLQYARRHLVFASGACVEQNGQFVRIDDNPDALKEFKAKLNPEWLINLADALQDTFHIGGK